MMLIDYLPNPPIELLARPVLRIGGLRISPQLSARQRITQYTGITVKPLVNNTGVRLALPPGARIGFPLWSHDGKRVAFALDAEEGVQLWVADPATGKAMALRGFFLNDVLGPPFAWKNDAYHDPGRPVYETKPSGESTIIRDGDWIYLSGRGATERGDMPFLDRMNIATLQTERLFRSDDGCVEQFLSFIGAGHSRLLMSYESRTDPPNYYERTLDGTGRKALTAFADPAPQLTGMKKELIRYVRPDGVLLSGTLYLPADHTAGTRLPCLIWAYPLEYSDATTAGQIRGSPNAFTFFQGASPLFFVTQGYAVLMDATMPVIGDPETVNNTFIEQIVSSARAAIDRLDSMGVIDRKRVCISGHSYGAFMTANLLAHSDLFAAGIARSGAYNRTLTPFGFQTERRSFWEAKETYMKMSPFAYADSIKAPLLLIHGEADNNSGTFPIQSERLFQALKGTGGTSKLVMLPFESHGYSARESVLHVLAESFAWAEKYVKSRPEK